MKKKCKMAKLEGLLFFFLWFFILVPLASGDDLNFLEGFRDIRWQEDIKNIKDLEPAGDFDQNWYRRRQEKLKIDNIDVESIFYGSCYDKLHNEIFCRLMIIIKDKSNFERLKNLLFEKFGEGRKNPFYEIWDWFLGKGVEIGRETGFSDEDLKALEKVFGAKIWMRLEFEEKRRKGILTVQNLEIRMQEMEEEARKAEEESRRREEEIRKKLEKAR